MRPSWRLNFIPSLFIVVVVVVTLVVSGIVCGTGAADIVDTIVFVKRESGKRRIPGTRRREAKLPLRHDEHKNLADCGRLGCSYKLAATGKEAGLNAAFLFNWIGATPTASPSSHLMTGSMVTVFAVTLGSYCVAKDMSNMPPYDKLVVSFEPCREAGCVIADR